MSSEQLSSVWRRGRSDQRRNSSSILIVLLLLVAARVSQAFLLPEVYDSCRTQRDAKKTALITPQAGASNGNPRFRLYNLYKKDFCLTKLPHPLITGQTMLGWADCSLPNTGTWLFMSNTSPQYNTHEYIGCYKGWRNILYSAYKVKSLLPITLASVLASQTPNFSTFFANCRTSANAGGYEVYSVQVLGTGSGTSYRCGAGYDIGHAVREGLFESQDSGAAPGRNGCFQCTTVSGTPVMCSNIGSFALYAAKDNVRSRYPPPLPSQNYYGRGDCNPTVSTAGVPFADVTRYSGWTHNANYLLGNNLPDPGPAGITDYFRLEINGTNEIVVAAAMRTVVYQTVLPQINDVLYVQCPEPATWPNRLKITRLVNPASKYFLHVVTPTQLSSRIYGATACGININPSISFFAGYYRYFTDNPSSSCGLQGYLISNTAADVTETWEVSYSQLFRITAENRVVFNVGIDPAYDIDTSVNQIPNKAIAPYFLPGSTSYFVIYVAKCDWRGTTCDSSYPAQVLLEGDAYINTFQQGFLASFFELGMRSNQATIEYFPRSTWDSLAVAQASTSLTLSRFFAGDHTCGCDTEPLPTDSAGRCRFSDFCPSGRNISTCGPRSSCRPRVDSIGYDCVCAVGLAYDPVVSRGLRIRDDVQTSPLTNLEINNCKEVTYGIEIGRNGFRIRVDTNVNNTVEFGETNYQVNRVLYGTPTSRVVRGLSIWNVYDVQSGATNLATPLNGRPFYIRLYNNLTGATLVDYGSFRLPCGCSLTTSSFSDWLPTSPRADDGRPTNVRVYQRFGELLVSWRDDSICSARFSFSRVVLSPDFINALSSTVLNDYVLFGNAVATAVQNERFRSTSLVSDYLRQNSNCGSEYGPLLVDDLRATGLPVGSLIAICTVATNPDLRYISTLSCAYQINHAQILFPALWGFTGSSLNGSDTAVADAAYYEPYPCAGSLWEASFSINVGVGRYFTFRAADRVELAWTAVDLTNNRPIVGRLPQYGLTGADGNLLVHFQACQQENTGLTERSLVRFSIVPKKIDNIYRSGAPFVLAHEFLCGEPLRECTSAKPLTLDILHETRNTIMSKIRDISTVLVSGVVTVDETQSPDTGFPKGCPIPTVEVCAFSAPGVKIDPASQKLGCATTDADGKYSFPVPMFATIVMRVTYLNHVFSSAQLQTIDSFYSVSTDDFSIDFVDVTKEQIYVDVYGGLCLLPIATGLTVRLTKQRDGCGQTFIEKSLSGSELPAPTANPTVAPTFAPSSPPVGTATGSPTLPTRSPTQMPSRAPTKTPSLSPSKLRSPTIQPTTPTTFAPTGYMLHRRFTATVPATFFEVTIESVNRFGTADLSLTTYFNQARFRGDDQRTVNLTSPDAQQSDMTDSAIQARRTVSYDYQVDPALTLEVIQGNASIIRRSSGCSDSSTVAGDSTKTYVRTYVLDGDITGASEGTNPINATIIATQTFFSSMTCSQVAGTINILDTLWDKSKAAGLENECKENVCSFPLVFDGNRSTTSRSVIPLPERVSPHWNIYEARWQGEDGVSKDVYSFHIITLGHAVNPSEAYQTIDVDPKVITVVRDPPGSESYQYMTNVESTVSYHFQSYEVFSGAVDDFKSGAKIKASSTFCAGLGAVVCALLGDGEVNLGVHFASTVKSVAGPTKYGRRSLSRTYTWSVETSREKDSPPGPESDMFLVVTEKILFIPVIRISEKPGPACTGQFDLSSAFFSAGDYQTRTGSPEKLDFTSTSWLSRYHIKNTILRVLEDVPEPQRTKQQNDTIDSWYSILYRSLDPDPAVFLEGYVNERLVGQFLSSLEAFGKEAPQDLSYLGTGADIDDLVAKTIGDRERQIVDGDDSADYPRGDGSEGYDPSVRKQIKYSIKTGKAINRVVSVIKAASDYYGQLKAKEIAKEVDAELVKKLAAEQERDATRRVVSNLEADKAAAVKAQQDARKALREQQKAFDAIPPELLTPDAIDDFNTERARLQTRIDQIGDLLNNIADNLNAAESSLRSKVSRLNIIKDTIAKLEDKVAAATRSIVAKINTALIKKLGLNLDDYIPKILKTGSKRVGSMNVIAALITIVINGVQAGVTFDKLLGQMEKDLDGSASFAFADTDATFRARTYYNTFAGITGTSKFKPLPNIMSLWDPRLRSEFLGADDTSLVSFVGGGSTMGFHVSDQDDAMSSLLLNGKQSETSLGYFQEGDVNIASIGLHSEGSLDFEVDSKWKQDVVNQAIKSTSAGFVLKDDTLGDEFTMKVMRDDAYGTFAFQVIGGKSKCPLEAGTYPREIPDLDLLSSPPAVTHPSKPASFMMRLSNGAETDVNSYYLTLAMLTLKDDVKVYVDGIHMTEPILFSDLEPLMSYPVLISVYKGSMEVSYDLAFQLTSICERTLGAAVQVTIDFAKPCPAVALGGDLAEGITLLAGDASTTVPLTAQNLDIGRRLWREQFPHVTEARFYYLASPSQTSWLDGQSARNASGQILNLMELEQPGTFLFATGNWDLAPLQVTDSIVRVRAQIECYPGPSVSRSSFPDLFTSVSPEGIIRIDRVRPKLYTSGPLEPFPTVDPIELVFTEPIRCGPPVGFQAKITLSNPPAGLQGTVIDLENGNLLAQCKDNVLSVSISQASFLGRRLLGLKAMLTVVNVKDIAGNLAEANGLVRRELGVIEFPFTFSAPGGLLTVVKGLAVTGINRNAIDIEAEIVTKVATILGVAFDSITLDVFSFLAPAPDGRCTVSVTIDPLLANLPNQGGRRRLAQSDLTEYLDNLISGNVVIIVPGGGVDVAPPKGGLACSGSGSTSHDELMANITLQHQSLLASIVTLLQTGQLPTYAPNTKTSSPIAKTASPNTKTASPVASATPAPNAKTSSPVTGSTPAPAGGATASPNAGTTSSPVSGATGAPASGATSSPNSGATASPNSGATSSPNSGATPAPVNGVVTKSPSLAGLCNSMNLMSQTDCNSRIAQCATYGIPMKWAGTGCVLRGRSPPWPDAGCQCGSFCGYRCKSKCNLDPLCQWTGTLARGRCVNRVTRVRGTLISVCPVGPVI